MPSEALGSRFPSFAILCLFGSPPRLFEAVPWRTFGAHLSGRPVLPGSRPELRQRLPGCSRLGYGGGGAAATVALDQEAGRAPRTFSFA